MKHGGRGLEFPALDSLAPDVGLVIAFVEQVKEAGNFRSIALNGDKLPIGLDGRLEGIIFSRSNLSELRRIFPVHELVDCWGSTDH